MRRGYYGLSGLVRNELGSDPLGGAGALYVFGSTGWSGRALCVRIHWVERSMCSDPLNGSVYEFFSKSRDRAYIISDSDIQSDDGVRPCQISRLFEWLVEQE